MSDTQKLPPVAASRPKSAGKAKKNPGPAPDARTRWATPHPWPFAEDLSEAEGQTLQAARRWAFAEESPRYRASLLALDVVNDGLFSAREGQRELHEFAIEAGLTASETAAFEVVAAFWQRKARDERRSEKRAAKAEQAGQSEVNP